MSWARIRRARSERRSFHGIGPRHLLARAVAAAAAIPKEVRAEVLEANDKSEFLDSEREDRKQGCGGEEGEKQEIMRS